MKKRVDLRIVKTKASLYRGFMKLMKSKTFESIKISDICSVSLINRSTFYDHFSDKFELLESLINDMRDELIDDLNTNIDTNNLKEYYMEVINILLNHIDKHKAVYSSIVKINSNSIAKDMLIDTLVTSIAREISDNYVSNSNVSIKMIVLFYTSGILNVILDELTHSNKFNKDSIYNMLDSLIQIDYLIKKK